MKDILISIVLVMFPIMVFLLCSCYNVLTNKKISRILFIGSMLCSLFITLNIDLENSLVLLFCNIPILICCFKKEILLSMIMMLIVIIYNYFGNINIIILCIKFFSYLVTYFMLFKRLEFNYLFFKIVGVLQGFFASFEFFIDGYNNLDFLLILIGYSIIVMGLVLLSLYLFKLADNVGKMYMMINKVNEENKVKNSLFKLTHEIKNPIAVCKGYLDMLDVNDKDKVMRYTNIIKSEIDRSLNVISDFMEYSKIKINLEEMDLCMLISEVYDSFNILLNDKNITFKIDNDYQELYMLGDYDRLKQVFVNVIKNSVEAIDKDGIIEVSVKSFKNNYQVIISDNGCGMNLEDIKNIKEMFYTTKKNGTGLGVALSNEIIVAHKGSIDYESELNNGTKCIINIPVFES